MNTDELAEKGLKLRSNRFGDAAVPSERMAAFGEFGEPLQHIINAYAYGDVWSRPGLSLGVKSLARIAMMAAANRPAAPRAEPQRRVEERLHAGGNPRKSSCWSRSTAASLRRTRRTARPSTCCKRANENRHSRTTTRT